MTDRLRVLSLNMHKGYTMLNGRLMVHDLREALREVSPDLVFLQEVQGEHARKAERHEDWPDLAQYEFLADEHWPEFAYGQNATYPQGHHGNSLLSKFPIEHWEQFELSTNPIEQRGLLYCRVGIPDWLPLHCICIHLNLSAQGRRKQLARISDFIHDNVPKDEPLIIAGDTNDWSGVPTAKFAKVMGLQEAFKMTRGKLARSYPANFPLLPLDRIYVRGLQAVYTDVYHGKVWTDLSDHAALVAEVERTI